MATSKKEKVARRHFRVRRKVSGSEARPRLYIRRALKQGEPDAHSAITLVTDYLEMKLALGPAAPTPRSR